MNGSPLTPLHGAPARAVVPGWFGMASTKWLTRIRLEATPSDNHFMVKGYRYTYPGDAPEQATPVETLLPKSLITRPVEGAKLTPGTLRVQGYAWAGPKGVRLVEISADGGTTWKPGGFMGNAAPMGWRFWATEFEVKTPGTITLMARCTDGAGQVQPLVAKPNLGGYGNNSIHKVSVRVGA